MEKAPLKLSPQLVPKPLWGISTANKLKLDAWQQIRLDAIRRAGSCCEICRESPSTPAGPRLLCHEVWEYNDKVGTATLVPIEVHCAECDLVTHMGRAKARGFLHAAIERLCFVNEQSKPEAMQVFRKAMNVWRTRNKRKWQITISSDLVARYPQLAILTSQVSGPR
jgi:hypothetical protein